MNRKKTKSDFSKFEKRNKHKRRSKEAAMRELRRAVEAVNPSYGGILRDVSVSDFERHRKKGERHTRGIYHGTRSGYGFVTPEDGERDVFIPDSRTLGALSGDIVELSYRKYMDGFGRERTEGRVTRIVEYGVDSLVGTLEREPSYMHGRRRISGGWIFLPDDGTMPRDLELVGSVMNARRGDKVRVRLLRGGRAGGRAAAEVVAVFGDSATAEANYKAILSELEVPVDFTSEELLQAERSAARPLSDENRVRFDGQLIMTVDGADAKDLDDAVSVRRTSTGWQLGVHIADVSAYVEEKTALDRAVMTRGTSLYFTDRVVPMLPPVLSNGACSLNAGEDKYALSAIINLDKAGEIINCRVVPAVVRSRVRGVYAEVNAILDGSADSGIKKKYKSVIPLIHRMKELYELLLKRHLKRGALELEIPESVILLSEDGVPEDVVARERGVGERIIEQLMLCANEAVAGLLHSKGIPCVYRVHAAPPEEKLEAFLTFARGTGLELGTGTLEGGRVDSRFLSALLKESEEKGLLVPVSYSMLRAMSKAEYSEVCGAHFGLGMDCYCHFTSPIRRLSDLATHRIIRRVLLEGADAARYASYARRAARAATECEIRALNAERRIENLYKAVFMSSHIGEDMDGAVSSVTAFGAFVMLDNTCEGLIPMSGLENDFSFDEHSLTLHSDGVTLTLGDRVRVRIEDVDISHSRTNFSLLEKL